MDNSRGELNFEVIQTNKKIDVLIDILAGKIDTNQINKDNAFIVFSPTIKNNKFTGRLGVEGIVEQLRKKIPNVKIGLFSGSNTNFNVQRERIRPQLLNEENKLTFDGYKIELQKPIKIIRLRELLQQRHLA